MPMKIERRFAAILVLAVACLPRVASAATITQTLSVPVTQLSSNAGGSARVFTLPFIRFDRQAGALTSVSWSWTGQIQYFFRGVGGAQVYDPESGLYVDTFGSFNWFNRQVYLRETAGNQIANPFLNDGFLQASVVLAPNATTAGYPGYSLRQTDTITAGTYTWSTAADLAAFIGPGNSSLSVAAQVAQTGVSDNGLAVFDGFSQFRFTSTLTFTYINPVVPEPSTLGLVGFVGVVLARRRR